MEIFDLWIFEIFYWDLNIWCVWAAHVSLNTDSCCLWGWKGQTLTFHGWWRPQPPFWNLRSLADKTGSGTQTWHQEKKLSLPFLEFAKSLSMMWPWMAKSFDVTSRQLSGLFLTLAPLGRAASWAALGKSRRLESRLCYCWRHFALCLS